VKKKKKSTLSVVCFTKTKKKMFKHFLAAKFETSKP